jgi:MFS family permease
LSFLTKSFGISSRRLFAITIINAGTLSWYMYFANYIGANIVFQNFTADLSLINMGDALFFLSAGVSALVGVLLSKRISNKRFLWAWTLFGVLSSALTLFFKGDIFVFIFSPLLGIAMGLGFPYSFSLLASHVKIEQRGRAAGIMLFETFVFAVVAGFVNVQFSLGVVGTVVTLVVLKATTFLLYLLPWILFIITVVLIDHVVWPTLEQDPQIYEVLNGPPYTYIGTTIIALVAGFIADKLGRKIPIFMGLAVLGFSSALLGSIVSPETAFIHHIAIGIAFGFLMTAYSIIPGDLSEKFNAEKLYALVVVLPLLIYFGLGALPQYFGQTATAISVAWILTSLIFASIAPIWYATETLPERIIRLRKRNEHIKKVLKLVAESENKE